MKQFHPSHAPFTARNWPMIHSRSLAAMAAIVTLFLTSSDAHAGFLSVTGAGNILDPSVTPTAATPNYFQDTGANK